MLNLLRKSLAVEIENFKSFLKDKRQVSFTKSALFRLPVVQVPEQQKPAPVRIAPAKVQAKRDTTIGITTRDGEYSEVYYNITIQKGQEDSLRNSLKPNQRLNKAR